MLFIFPIFLLLLINLWLFMPFFGLGLFGDDWLTIFRYFYYLEEPKHLGTYSTEYFNHFKYFLNAYGPQDILMALLYKTFGEQSSVYFILSYVLRVGAGLAIFLPAFYITKNKWAAALAVIFFLFSATGLEASSWVFNMPSYIAIIFFNLLLYFYLRFHSENKLGFLILSLLFFGLAIVSTPIRAHGLIPFIIFVETLFIILKRNLRLIKTSLIRIGGFLLVFSVIYFLGLRETISGNFFNATVYGLNNTLLLISQNRFDFLFFPVATLGSMLIPDSLAPNFGLISSYIFLVLIGGCLLITVFTIALFSKSQILKKVGILLALGWTVISYLYPWWTTQSLIPTNHRYLIISSAGMSLLISILISLGKNAKNITTLLAAFSIILILHTIDVKKNLNTQYQTHNRETVKKLWSAIPYAPEVGKSAEPLVFYFEGNGTNESIIRDSITFGFPPHMALIYGITEEELMPIPMSDFKQVQSAVLDGKSLAAYGRVAKPLPVERIYAFHLKGTDNLINITDEVRKKLVQIVE